MKGQINIPHVREIISAIKREASPNNEVGFNMAVWWGVAAFAGMDRSGANCGTVACIAGWSNILAELGKTESASDSTAAQHRIGLTGKEAEHLFLGIGAHVTRSRITAEQAVRVLENLIETGEVNWECATRDAVKPKDKETA